MSFGEVTHDGQSHPRTCAHWITAYATTEHSRPQLWIQSRSIVVDRQAQHRALAGRLQLHLRPRPFECVVEDVPQHLLEIRFRHPHEVLRRHTNLERDATLRAELPQR